MIYKAILKNGAVLAACNVDNDVEAIINLTLQVRNDDLLFITWQKNGCLIENPEGFKTSPGLIINKD